MEALGLAVAIVVAAGGWIVSGVLARRGARRDLRVQYLVSAYRALDDASNRSPISAQHERSLETAVADVVLLGTDQQVELANAFSRAFAQDGHADSSQLLEALRVDLRKELLLGDVGPRSTWLRIESGRQWAAESARVRAGIAQSQAVQLAADRPNEARSSDDQGDTALHVILAAFRDVEDAVLKRHPSVGKEAGDPSAVAVRSGLVSPASAQALEGLSIMRDLAAQDPSRLGEREVAEYVTLARALSYAIRTERLEDQG